jgi:hypothetical protein
MIAEGKRTVTSLCLADDTLCVGEERGSLKGGLYLSIYKLAATKSLDNGE